MISPKRSLRLLSLLIAFTVLAQNALAAAKPNFVIIILDDWGILESGAYGNKIIQTPNIDQLAQQGLQFNNAFLTASTCSSSRASILTGLHPVAAGVRELHVPMPADRKLVSYYLRQAGYYTVAAGKWHIGGEVVDQFDKVIAEQQLPNETQSGAEDWVQVIKDLPKQKPFFLWLAAKDAHKPWNHEAKWDVHDPQKITVPPYIVLSEKYTAAHAQLELSEYYNELYRADFYIGQAIQTLRETNRLNNTLVIVMSDNGSPFWKAKKYLTDPGLRTPFIVYWPEGIKQHHEIDELISAVDIAPTLLNLAGISLPPQLEGYSFAPWLLRPDQAPTPIREFVYGERGDATEASHNGRSIRDKKFLYIENDYKEPWTCLPNNEWLDEYREQLFDVVNDPYDLDNLLTPKQQPLPFWQKFFANSKPKKIKTDHEDVAVFYQKLMHERRTQRKDLPDPVDPNGCLKNQSAKKAEPPSSAND